MMEGEEDSQPFWLQTTDNLHHPGRSLRRQASIFLNSGVFLIVLLVVAFAFVFFIIPSVISFTSQIFRPNLIKKSWDSFNLVLVLVAIICGLLSRKNHNNNNNENTPTSYYGDRSLSNLQQDVQKSYPSTPHRWYDYQDRPITYSNTLNRMRSFSSYPDLRQESLERWRFYDDTHLNNYRFPSSADQIHHRDHHLPEQLQKEEAKRKEEEDTETKDIVVDTFVKNDQKDVSFTAPSPPLPLPPSPPPAPPPKVVRRKAKRAHQDLGYETHEEKKDYEINNLYIPPPSPPPPPPPPPPPMFGKHEKRRGKDFLISLRRKKKKQRQKSVENLDSLFNPQSSTSVSVSLIPPPSPPPPPPPPLPPPHFFQNLFSSKKGKPKKLPSVPPPPPPPPPPVTRVSKIISTQNVTSTTKVQAAPITSDKSPKPVKTSSFSSVEDNVDSGNASPLIPIPPPPPPFKMPAWKFVLDGDYVRVDSFNSSRSGSPELESLEDGITSDKDESSPLEAAAAAMPLFCPSPDVNTKADNFIARFRAGLKLEKVNSVKGRSNLGPEASTS